MSFTDTFATPDDTGPLRASELKSSFGESLAAQAAETLDPESGVSGFQIWRRMNRVAAGGDFIPVAEAPAPFDTAQLKADVADTSVDDARARLRQQGLEKSVKLPDAGSIKAPVLDLLIEEAKTHRDRRAAIDRGPQGFMTDALGVGTSLLVGAIDPINIGAAFIPVLGEARWGQLMAAAGESTIRRAGARALGGAIQGGVGNAMLVPAEAAFHKIDNKDYTFAQALHSVIFGAGIGSVLHAGPGAIGDIMRRRRAAADTGDGGVTLEGAEARSHVVEGFEAYHGTPHDFDRFDASQIGEGEGYQAFGHGLYVAENEEVARAYRSMLAPASKMQVAAENAVKQHGTREKALADATERLERVRDYERRGYRLDPENTKFQEDLVAALAAGEGRPGQVYRVKVNADREHFLDWDKPASAQPDGLRRAYEANNLDLSGATTGEDAYRQLATKLGSDAAASAAFHAAGVPGIRYLDQGSRNGGGWHITPPDQTVSGKWMVKSSDYNSKGLHFDTEVEAKVALAEQAAKQTRNYVIFDDKLIGITHKNGSPLFDVIEDLPPRMREDAMRAAIAGVTRGEPVRAGELLGAAAKDNPNATGVDVDADWRSLATERAEFDEPTVVEASQRVDALPAPSSLAGEPSARRAAAERALAETEADYKANEPYLPEEVKLQLERNLKTLDIETADREHVLSRGAACLAAAIG